MSFLWPHMFWLALAPLLLVAGVALLQRRGGGTETATAFLARNRVGGSSRWRRHLPAGLLAASFALLVGAAARPHASVVLPSNQQTVILAMDVSGSMQAPDVAPNRLSASQTAAKAFAARLPREVRVGVVAYADSAQLVQPPTAQRDDVLTAIDRFQLQQGTAIGSGILAALGAIFPEQDIDPYDTGTRRHQPLRGSAPKTAPGGPAAPVPPGSYASAVIVLLTDGQNTIGPDPLDAAQQAASRGVKVFTVGFGTKDGEIVGFEGFSILVRLDEETLRQIADTTRGEYFHAGSGAELDRVYAGLQSKLVLERQDTELTALFAAAGAAALALAMMLAAWWHGRVA